MTVRLISDGTPQGTQIIDVETGENLTKRLAVREVSFVIRPDELATLRINAGRPSVDVSVETVQIIRQTAKREFFWSARTLRCDEITEEDGVPVIETHDVLGTDSTRSIYATGNYGELIARLLTEHFAREARQ